MTHFSPRMAIGSRVLSTRVVAVAAALQLACASGTVTPDPGLINTPRPVEFEAYRGAYSYEFLSEYMVIADTISTTPAAAWQAIARAYADVGLPSASASEGTTTFGVPRATVRRSLAGVPLSRFLRCGETMGVPNANAYDVTLSLITKLLPVPTGSLVVQSQLRATARQSGVSSHPLPCTSTGDLERRVARLIEYHASRS